MGETSNAVSRRRLMVGGAAAAGLVIGGSAVEAARGSAAADGPGPYLASPGEELMTEHGVLKRVLLSYRAAHDRLTSPGHVDAGMLAGVVSDAAQLVSDYVESFHEGLEEAYVFPRVAPQEPALIRTLLVQHDRGRHLTAAITAVATSGLSSPAARDTLSGYLASFVRMYEPHEAWEDTVVYPRLRQVSSQRTLDELAARFAELENSQYGDAALATMLGRVAGIEQQLGIADLAAFTPALV